MQMIWSVIFLVGAVTHSVGEYQNLCIAQLKVRPDLACV